MKAVAGFLERLTGGLGGGILAILLGLVLVAVVARYFASYSIPGSDELAIWLHVAMVFVCLPLVSGSSLAMRLDIVSSHLGRTGRALCNFIADAVIIHASLVLLTGGIAVVRQMGGVSPMLGVPEWVRFAPVVFGASLTIIVTFLNSVGDGKILSGLLAVMAGAGLWLFSHYGVFEPVAFPSFIAGGVALMLLFLGAPLPHALVCGLSIAIPFGAALPEPAIIQNTVSGIGKFMLLAIPFFLLAGVLMNIGGLAQRLVALAASLVGHFRGGIAQTTLVTNVLFAGVSGSSIADAAFGAKVFTPALIEHGYKPERAAAIVAATSVLPNIIPPSIAFLILASVTNLSVGALFLGGLAGGVLLAAFLAAGLYFMSVDIGRRQERASSKDRSRALINAVPALGLAVIILVCIRFGVMTTTEAAGLAGFYALCVAWWTGGAGSRRIRQAFVQSAGEAAAVGLLIGTSAPFVFLLAVDDLPSMVQQVFASLDGPLAVLLLANAILLVAGCFLDIGAAILLLAPLLMPAAIAAGIDPVDFGVVLVVNLMIGGLTPPVGILVYVSSRLSGLQAAVVFRSVLPLIGILLCGLAVITAYAVIRSGA